jgi:hypothetical protein
MEELKKYDEVHERDVRQHHFVVWDESTRTHRKIELSDHYKYVEELKLIDEVPNDIKSHFEMARNIYLYAWFHYPFYVAAWLYALITVEYALREKLKRTDVKFKDMMIMAIKNKWIRAENYSHIAREIKQLDEFPGELNMKIDQDMLDNYCKNLTGAIPEFRNDLAHGTNMLLDTSDGIKICVETINQIFKSDG